MTDNAGIERGKLSSKLRSMEEIEAKLASELVARGHLSRDRMEEIQHRTKWLDEPLDRALIHEKLVSEDLVLELLSEISGIPVMPVSQLKIEEEAVKLVPPKVVAHYRIMPIRVYGGSITAATDRVGELDREDQLRIVLGCSVRWVLCKSHEISECIKHYYGVGIGAFAGLTVGDERAQAAAKNQLHLAADGTDITAFVLEIIRDGVESNATDIHFEPTSETLRLRYRIDGVLSAIPLPHGVDKHLKPIISSIKVMAQLNIAEKRLPQDGRFGFSFNGQDMDVRVSVLPTQYGEAVNLRILNRKEIFLKMEDLGLRDFQMALLSEFVELPHGIILFTGATGSGKTTSLYASLSRINTDELKIITIEDPVEYQLAGVTQMQVHPEIDFTFANGLRSILRHDPDVVLIGEIRDQETARIATSAALTGHLVFSTLHTNDSASAMTRLIDMGIEPYLVTSSLEGVVAQQLVRRVCNTCREPIAVDGHVVEEIRDAVPEAVAGLQFFHGRGCPDCRYTGFSGRKGVYEVLPMDDEIRSLTIERASSAVIMQRAIENGLITLRQSGWMCAVDGTTSVDEVLRVTPKIGRRRRGKAPHEHVA
jgi:type II secretory ATPase GspE/PulE/Tfp pilus assembly ATPase PilB-like protein